MNQEHKSTIEHFLNACSWAHEVWSINRHLIEQNNDKETTIEKVLPLFFRFSTILKEYTLLQISKLHDPSHTHGKANLSVSYILSLNCWDQTTLTKLSSLKSDLDQFHAHIKSARNQILSHNDVATIHSNQSLGQFEKGHDEDYFNVLNNFLEVITSQFSIPFAKLDDCFVEEDVMDLLEILKMAAI